MRAKGDLGSRNPESLAVVIPGARLGKGRHQKGDGRAADRFELPDRRIVVGREHEPRHLASSLTGLLFAGEKTVDQARDVHWRMLAHNVGAEHLHVIGALEGRGALATDWRLMLPCIWRMELYSCWSIQMRSSVTSVSR